MKDSIQRFFFISLLLGALILPGSAQAQSRTEHVVKQGETLFSISRQYNITVEDIRKWNNISGNTISVNQRLVVSPPRGEEAESTEIKHRVSAGETLFAISRRYGVTVNDIRAWNAIEGTAIEIGQVLVIKGSVQNIKEPIIEPADERITATEAPSAYYVVRRGDFLSKIALQFGLTTEELMEINRLKGINLSVGQVLLVRKPQSLPSMSDSEEGTTAQGRFVGVLYDGEIPITELLKKNEMTPAEFSALNPGLDLENLRSGTEINILLPPDIIYTNPYRITPADTGRVYSIPSMYPDRDRGRALSNGDLYNPDAFTAGHSTIPLGTVVHIVNPASGTGIFVLINDRILDSGIRLSRAAYEHLKFTDRGLNAALVIEENEW